jgi:hypothetical protein
VSGTQGSLDFALIGPLPSVARRDRLSVSFILPDASPAELALFDVAGRRVACQQVRASGAGPEVVDLAPGVLIEPGLYLVRLSQGARSRIVKVIVTR